MHVDFIPVIFFAGNAVLLKFVLVPNRYFFLAVNGVSYPVSFVGYLV